MEGRITFSSGYVQEGVFHGGLLNGFGKEINAKVGRHYEGSFKDGTLLVLTQSLTRSSSYFTMKGKWDRQGKVTYVNSGTTYQGIYLQGWREGRWIFDCFIFN